MVFTKKIHIKNKRFKKNDVLEIARAVEKEFSENDYNLEFTIDFWDEISITDKTIEVFNSLLFDRKRAKRIYMQYYGKDRKKHIEITLCDSTYSNVSEILLASEDEQWFNYMIAKFSDVISDVEKQCCIAMVTNSPLFAGSGWLIGAILSITCQIILYDITKNVGIIIPTLIYILVVLFIFVINYAICVFAFKYIEKAYPSIDFCFGPDHMNRSLNNRNVIYWCFGAFAPTAILAAIEYLSSFF